MLIESGQIENQDKKNVNEFENLPNAFFGMLHFRYNVQYE